MHIHGMQNNAAFEMNALHAAQQALARQRAEETRKRLFEFASEVAGEAQDCIVTLSEQHKDESRRQDRKRREYSSAESGQEEEPGVSQVSDYA